MTTTMESHIDLQYSAQSPPQEQAQANPPSVAPPTLPENAGTQDSAPGNDTDSILAKAQMKRKAELRALGKTFGHIPNVPVFSEWETRLDCSQSAVHRSILAGICGNRKEGAYSVALSCLYKDDEDGGDVIIYTGTGGRKRWSDIDPTKRLRVGPQTEDQSWDHPQNKALTISFLTGEPVRVIRSWRCPSRYAPIKGYRYDGLYRVAAYWTAMGRNRKKICRCRLERLPDQPLIPVRPVTLSTNRRGRTKRLVSRLTCSPSPSSNSCHPSNETDSAAAQNHPNTSATQLAGNTGREAEGLSSPQQQRPMPDTSSGIDLKMDESDLGVEGTQPLPPQHRIPPRPGALPRYRWDPKTAELIRVPASDPIPADLSMDAAEGEEEEYRGEDDGTLVPSEDGHVDMLAIERMETEYVPSDGETPRPGTPDEPHASGSSVLENQGDN